MLTNKEEMSIAELKSFLQSHLGEKSSTELFQELLCAKLENETVVLVQDDWTKAKKICIQTDQLCS